MVGEVRVGRDVHVERVHAVGRAVVGPAAIVARQRPEAPGVDAVAGGEAAVVVRVEQMDVAVVEAGLTGAVQLPHRQRGLAGHVLLERVPPPHAHHVLQEVIDRVERAARAPARQHQVATHRPHRPPLGVPAGRVQAVRPGEGGRPEIDGGGVLGLVGLADHGERRAGRLAQVLRQLPPRGPLSRDRLIAQHDRREGLALAGQRHLRPRGRRRQLPRRCRHDHKPRTWSHRRPHSRKIRLREAGSEIVRKIGYQPTITSDS